MECRIAQDIYNVVFCHDFMSVLFNSLCLSDALGWHPFGSTMAQVMVRWLMASSNYQNLNWLIFSEIFTRGNFARKSSGCLSLIWVRKLMFDIIAASPRGLCFNGLFHLFFMTLLLAWGECKLPENSVHGWWGVQPGHIGTWVPYRTLIAYNFRLWSHGIHYKS